MKRLVAFAGHAPGLWLVYRERLPPSLVRPNLIAIALTLGATAGAFALAGGLAAVLAWAIGHGAWGTYLAARLPAS